MTSHINCRKCGGPHFTIKCDKDKKNENKDKKNNIKYNDIKHNDIKDENKDKKNKYLTYRVKISELPSDLTEKEKVIRKLTVLDKEVIAISLSQMHAFCGNILQLKNSDGNFKIAMSATAESAFSESQLTQLRKHGEFIVVDIPTVEVVGGGGIRCMLAEVF